jgi:hypothetical protein
MGIFEDVGNFFGNRRDQQKIKGGLGILREELGIQIGSGSAQSRENATDRNNELREAQAQARIDKLRGTTGGFSGDYNQQSGGYSNRQTYERGGSNMGGYNSGSFSDRDLQQSVRKAGLSNNDQKDLAETVDALITDRTVVENGRVNYKKLALSLEDLNRKYPEINVSRAVQSGNLRDWENVLSGLHSVKSGASSSNDRDYNASDRYPTGYTRGKEPQRRDETLQRRDDNSRVDGTVSPAELDKAFAAAKLSEADAKKMAENLQKLYPDAKIVSKEGKVDQTELFKAVNTYANDKYVSVSPLERGSGKAAKQLMDDIAEDATNKGKGLDTLVKKASTFETKLNQTILATWEKKDLQGKSNEIAAALTVLGNPPKEGTSPEKHFGEHIKKYYSDLANKIEKGTPEEAKYALNQSFDRLQKEAEAKAREKSQVVEGRLDKNGNLVLTPNSTQPTTPQPAVTTVQPTTAQPAAVEIPVPSPRNSTIPAAAPTVAPVTVASSAPIVPTVTTPTVNKAASDVCISDNVEQAAFKASRERNGKELQAALIEAKKQNNDCVLADYQTFINDEKKKGNDFLKDVNTSTQTAAAPATETKAADPALVKQLAAALPEKLQMMSTDDRTKLAQQLQRVQINDAGDGKDITKLANGIAEYAVRTNPADAKTLVANKDNQMVALPIVLKMKDQLEKDAAKGLVSQLDHAGKTIGQQEKLLNTLRNNPEVQSIRNSTTVTGGNAVTAPTTPTVRNNVDPGDRGDRAFSV